MTTVVRSNIRNQAYQILRQRILDQTYSFGQRINIDTLSKELAVSNNPIREALSMLERDGLVTYQPNVGTKVVEFSQEQFRQLTETIEVLISGAYLRGVHQGTQHLLIERMEAALANQHQLLDTATDTEFADAAMAFDECFVKVTDNVYLAKLFDGIADLFFMALLYDYQNRGLARTENIGEHARMLEAIKAGDHKQVLKEITDHYGRDFVFPHLTL